MKPTPIGKLTCRPGAPKTRFRIRTLHPPAGEVCGAGGSPLPGLDWKSYRGFIASAMA